MMIKEINDHLDEDITLIEKLQEISVAPPKENTYPVESRFRYRYNEIDLSGKQFLVKRSCNHCHGTGIVGWFSENKAKGTPRMAIHCTCLIKTEEEEISDAEKA